MRELLPKVFVNRAAGALTVDNQSAGAVVVKQRALPYGGSPTTLMTVTANSSKTLAVSDDADFGIVTQDSRAAADIPQPVPPAAEPVVADVQALSSGEGGLPPPDSPAPDSPPPAGAPDQGPAADRTTRTTRTKPSAKR